MKKFKPLTWEKEPVLSKDLLHNLSSKELPQEFSKLVDENFDELIGEEPKEETLEEAAERLIFKTIGGNYGIMSSDENDQVDGYYNTYEEAYLTLKLKWQEERMYSEDEVDELVNNLIDKFLNYNGSSVDNEKLKWFYQQIKKK